VAKKENLVTMTLEQVKEMLANGGDRSDWEAVRAMPQEEVDRLADEEDGPLPEGWEKTIVFGIPQPKKAVHIRLDAQVLNWFKSQGPGYQTRINEVLRAFVASRQRN